MNKGKAQKRRDNILGYTFLLPWILGFLAFTAGPFFYTIYLSFHQVTLTVRGWETTWNNYDNYLSAFLRNTEFVPALLGFIAYELIYVPVIIVIAFILALLLNQQIRFRAGFRLIYFLPVIIMSGSVMQQLIDSGTTTIGSLKGSLIYNIIFNYNRYLAWVVEYIFDNFSMVLWFTGIPIILIINGLQKINPSIYEAAKLDGATPWQALWKITIPLIKAIVLVATVFTIVQLGMYNLNPVYQMIQDTIYNTTGGLGLASAYAWVYAIVVLSLVAVTFGIFRERERRR